MPFFQFETPSHALTRYTPEDEPLWARKLFLCDARRPARGCSVKVELSGVEQNGAGLPSTPCGIVALSVTAKC